jgi:Protein of unknown function (DUF3460)
MPILAKLRNMMLPSRDYVSDHTKFMHELMKEKPELLQKQREARAIWWDKTPGELSEERRMDKGRVPQSPYVYSSD